jgi:hypothetical protein
MAEPCKDDHNGSRSPEAAEGANTVDDQFARLLEGLRTSLPAVQVLFAFLLTAPLQRGFDDIDGVQRSAFATAFYASGLASVLLIAPSVHQRIRAPSSGLIRRSKRHLIWATWVAIVGSVVMAVAVLATVFLVSSLVFSTLAAAIASTLVAAVLSWAWFYLPLVTFHRLTDYGAEPVGEATIDNGAGFGERSEPKRKPQPEPDVTYPRES